MKTEGRKQCEESVRRGKCRGWLVLSAAEAALGVTTAAESAETGGSQILKTLECHTKEFRLYPVQTVPKAVYVYSGE